MGCKDDVLDDACLALDRKKECTSLTSGPQGGCQKKGYVTWPELDHTILTKVVPLVRSRLSGPRI